MGAAHGSNQRRLPDCDRANSVHNGNGEHLVLSCDLLSHFKKYRSSSGMALIGERGNGSAMVVIAHVT
jgi:hypothetical protein